MVYLSLTTERAVATTFQSLALGSTVFRLYRRYKQKSLWWDDCWVFVAFLLDLVYCSTIVLRPQLDPNLTPTPQVRYHRIVTFWITGTLPPLIVWFSRISICLSIAKIDMQIAICRIRILFYCLIMAFGLFAAAMLLQKIWICARNTSWYDTPAIWCRIGEARGLMSLVGDLLADTALTILSLNLVWKVRMRPSQRKLLSLIALANILSSMAGIVYGVTQVQAEKLGDYLGLIMGLIVHIKTATTLTVSNLLIVVTYLYVIFCRSSGDSQGRTDTTPATGRHSQLPDGRVVKSTPVPHPGRTIYILTQFDSNGSALPYSQQDLAAYTWAGSEVGWRPRPPFTAFTESEESREPSSSFSPNSRNDSHPHELSRSLSEPCPRQPPKVYFSASGASDERRR